MSLPKAKTPFEFFARLSLTVATGQRARDAEGLLEALKSLPDSVIYTHTHRFVQEHQFLVPEPPNDFALWAADALQDEELAERLAAVDTVAYSAIADLRAALAGAVERHLKKKPARQAPAGEEFHFLRSVRFSMSTGRKAADLSEFAGHLRKAGVATLYLHVFEARLRPPLGVNDFSVWFERDLGEAELARRVSELDPYGRTLSSLRDEIAGLAEARAAELGA